MHVKAVHLKEKQLKCECGFSTAYRRQLSLHKRIVHMKDGHTECPTCHKVLSRKLKLDDHIRRVHTKDAKPFKCDHCEYSEFEKSAVKKHMLICKPYSCPYCNIILANKTLLNEHKKREQVNVQKH